jgi:hypothetical protein
MKRSILILRVPTNQPSKFVDFELDYYIGGMNYFQGVTEQRGYWIGVTPREVKDHCTSTMSFAGTKDFLEPAARFSEGAMQRIAKDLQIEVVGGCLKSISGSGKLRRPVPLNPRWERLLFHVLRKSPGLELRA